MASRWLWKLTTEGRLALRSGQQCIDPGLGMEHLMGHLFTVAAGSQPIAARCGYRSPLPLLVLAIAISGSGGQRTARSTFGAGGLCPAPPPRSTLFWQQRCPTALFWAHKVWVRSEVALWTCWPLWALTNFGYINYLITTFMSRMVKTI